MIVSKDGTIKLSPIEEGDIDKIKVWRNNQNLQKYFREYRLFSTTQINKWYSSMIHDNRFEMFTVADNTTNEIVGVCGLTYIDWINRHADVHIYTGKDSKWVDNKYCPPALDAIVRYGFYTLNLNKLWAEVYEIDKLKLKFFSEHSFKMDACLRQHYFYEGEYYNSHILSILRGEFE